MSKRILLCLLCLLPVVPLGCAVLSASDSVSYADEFGAERVREDAPAAAREATEGIDPVKDIKGLETGFGNLLRIAGRLLPDAIGTELRTLLALFVAAGLCAVLGSFTDKLPPEYLAAAGALAVAGITLTGLHSLLGTVRGAMNELTLYSHTLLSTLAALTAASGAPTAALLNGSVTAMFCDLLMTLYERLLVPLLYMYAALLTAHAALPRLILERIAAFVKWLCTGILTMTLIVFTGYISLSGAIHGRADQLAVRGARAAITGSVPVVGRIIADATEAVLAGAGLLRGSVGLFGLIAVLGIALAPLLGVLARYLVFKLGGALIGTVGDASLGRYVENLAGLFSLLLAVVCATTFLLIISVISFVQAGG